jgi:ribosomal protein L29
MTDPITQALQTAQAALAALAEAGRRQAEEHAWALDELRREVADLRAKPATMQVHNVGPGEHVEVARCGWTMCGQRPCSDCYPVKAPPWTPKVGDRVRIARAPWCSTMGPEAWASHGCLGQVGDEGLAISKNSRGEFYVQANDGARPIGYIALACLEPA